MRLRRVGLRLGVSFTWDNAKPPHDFAHERLLAGESVDLLSWPYSYERTRMTSRRWRIGCTGARAGSYTLPKTLSGFIRLKSGFFLTSSQKILTLFGYKLYSHQGCCQVSVNIASRLRITIPRLRSGLPHRTLEHAPKQVRGGAKGCRSFEY